MTPTQEAAYALTWNLPRDDLDPPVQLEYDRLKLEYDRLKMEREARPQIPAAASRKTPRWQYLIPFWTVGIALIIWATAGVAITGSHMNFTTLRSDISKIRLPAGYEKMSASESGSDCASRRCALTEFWVWRGSSAHTAADACQDVSRAMEAGLGDATSNAPDNPRGTACEYFTTLESYFHPGLGKRQVEAFVWVNDKAKGSPGGYIVELITAYNYFD
jgi:hypothetical protein